jgi:DNA-binding transcriptional ArsR family regulator
VIAIDDEEAGNAFAALSSETAREILSRLYDDPGTASEIAGDVGTSLQNANYHLTNLTEAGLIEVRDVRYSDQGKEMRVYAPTNRALVLFAGEDLDRSSLFETVKRLLLPVGVLAIVSVAVDVVVRSVLSPPEDASPTDTGTGMAADPDRGGALPTSSGSATDTVTPTPVNAEPESVSAVADMMGIGLPPGVLFFLGGLLALLMFHLISTRSADERTKITL